MNRGPADADLGPAAERVGDVDVGVQLRLRTRVDLDLPGERLVRAGLVTAEQARLRDARPRAGELLVERERLPELPLGLVEAAG